jgi:PAS domain S-box-containing protein
MTAKYYKTESIAKKLNVLFERYISGERTERSGEETELCKQLFSHNVLFLRTYLGFMVNGYPFDQVEFASLLGISAAGLRRWESAGVIPNELSLRAITQYANQVLNLPIPIQNAHLLYSDLVTELTLLRMGSHSSTFKNMSIKQQRQFASFMSNNMDRLLDYFMDEAQETKLNFEILLDNALVGIYVFNNKGKIVYANQTLSRMNGYSPEEMRKIDYETFIHPDDLKESRRKIRDRISGEKPEEHYVFRVRNKNGEYRKQEVFSSRILIEGEPAILGVVQDITERLENERLIRESEEKFRVMASSALDAVIMIDDEGKVTFWNNAAEHIFGYTSDEMMGKELHIIIAPERYRQKYKAGIKQFLKTGTGHVIGRIIKFSGLRKDGTEFPVEISLSGVKLNDAWNAIGIVRDITERINAEKSMND